MTQFGYANWIGNKSDSDLRKKSAEEKFESIKKKIEILKPDTVIPFASFIYFCHPENFYMNDNQNSPEKLNSYMKKFNLSKKIIVLKPFDEIVLNSNLQNYDENIKNSRIKYWNRLINSCSEEKIFEKKYSNEEIYNEYTRYRKKLWQAFLFIPSLLER